MRLVLELRNRLQMMYLYLKSRTYLRIHPRKWWALEKTSPASNYGNPYWLTLPETNSSRTWHPKRKQSYSNHLCSSVNLLLYSFREGIYVINFVGVTCSTAQINVTEWRSLQRHVTCWNHHPSPKMVQNQPGWNETEFSLWGSEDGFSLRYYWWYICIYIYWYHKDDLYKFWW